MTSLAATLILSYLVGSIPTSIIVGKIFGNIDIRNHGSKNAGMTNIYRILGWKPALIVAVVDVFKGWLATAQIAFLFPQSMLLIEDPGVVKILAGFAAVMGHTFTIFARFRGGKGVATIAGMLIALYPLAVLPCFVVFALSLMMWGYVSVASMAAAVALPMAVFVLPLFGFQDPQPSLKTFSLLIPLFVLFTHRSNIKRLREGIENRFDKVIILGWWRKKS